MDNLTHSLFGLAVARAGLGRHTPYATATLVLASNVPDLDIVTALTGGQVAYLAAHRGFTHGVLGIVVMAAATAAVVQAWRWWRSRGRDGGAGGHWAGLMGVALVGTAFHVLMDLPTAYGTRVLSPFDQTWYAVDWIPIIDPYLWAVLIAGLAAGAAGPRWRRRAARAALVAMAVLYAVRGAAHGHALRVAAAADAGDANACASAPTLVRHPTVLEAAAAGPGACLQATALPTFLSPFEWRVVRQYGAEYVLRELVLSPAGVRWRGEAERVPSLPDPWVARARATPTARVFLNFARLPAARTALTPDGTYRVRFADMRFVGGLFSIEEAAPRAPFIVTVEMTPDGRVTRETLGAR